jgi:hypothetical protein
MLVPITDAEGYRSEVKSPYTCSGAQVKDSLRVGSNRREEQLSIKREREDMVDYVEVEARFPAIGVPLISMSADDIKFKVGGVYQ